MNQSKSIDLFSGIGGFALGLDSTGIFETVKFVEKDKYCQKVLQKKLSKHTNRGGYKKCQRKRRRRRCRCGRVPLPTNVSRR